METITPTNKITRTYSSRQHSNKLKENENIIKERKMEENGWDDIGLRLGL